MPKVSYIMLWQFLEMYYAHNKVMDLSYALFQQHAAHGPGTLQLTRAALAGRPDVL